jgi:hypothetical protein
MELEIEVYGALCSLSTFKINGIDADERDFVDKYDHDSDNAEDYACGNMQADIISSSEDVLKKYGISESEYHDIASNVAEKVSFGCCGWCV